MDCFALIMVGLPHMNAILEKPVHEALNNVLLYIITTVACLQRKQREYIYSRIEAAGGARSIIDEAAVHAVAGYCQGTPRIINSIMTNALMLGTQLKSSVSTRNTSLQATVLR